MRIEASPGTKGVDETFEVEVRFGSVVLEHGGVDQAEVDLNVERGRSALSRMGTALTAPGVRLDVARGVPLYHADPQHPDRLVRELDGQRQSGVLVDGEFKAL